VSKVYLASGVAVVALVTLLLRALPFLIFRRERKTPELVLRLGRMIPFAAVGMLSVYCLKDLSFSSFSGWLPELLAVAVVTGLHLWRKNTLLSMIGGTACYMLLVQFVFR